MAAAAVANSNGASANGPTPGRLASVYSEVQTSRIAHALPLPSVLRSHFTLADGAASSATGNPEEIAKLFPNLYGQPSAAVVPSAQPVATKPLKIGVVLSGGQAPGGHNVICGIFDYLQERAKGSTMYGFKGGPAGVMKGKYVELNADFVYPYRNQGGFDMICSGRDKIETPEQFKQCITIFRSLPARKSQALDVQEFLTPEHYCSWSPLLLQATSCSEGLQPVGVSSVQDHRAMRRVAMTGTVQTSGKLLFNRDTSNNNIPRKKMFGLSMPTRGPYTMNRPSKTIQRCLTLPGSMYALQAKRISATYITL